MANWCRQWEQKTGFLLCDVRLKVEIVLKKRWRLPVMGIASISRNKCIPNEFVDTAFTATTAGFLTQALRSTRLLWVYWPSANTDGRVGCQRVRGREHSEISWTNLWENFSMFRRHTIPHSAKSDFFCYCC